jgi:hypothetical protein
MNEAAQAAIESFAARLHASGEMRFALEPNSSDLLLVLLLPKIGKHLATLSTDAGTDGGARVRWFAEHFSESPSGVTGQLPDQDETS